MKIKTGYKIRDIAGEKVIILQGTYGADMTKLISLNSSAEWLFRQLEGKQFDIDDVADLLLEYYDIDRSTASRDAGLWAQKLVEFGIIEE